MSKHDDGMWAEFDRLRRDFPAFRFSRQRGWEGPRWSAERVNGLHPGLHTLITPDLGELRAVLTSTEGSGHVG